jgi:signal transduction histidine kinase
MGEGGLEQILVGVEARCVVATDRAAWCGTDGAGVVAVGRDPINGPVVARLDTEHGLPSNAVFALAACRDPADACSLWIGTSRGVARYEPGTIAPAIHVARAFGARAYDPDEALAGLALEYPQNGLALEMAATSSRTFPEQFQYAFAVFDAAGKLVAKRLSHDAQLTLANLRPGRYRVEARAYSNDLVVSDPLVVSFEVERAPFPWGVAALSMLLALALVALWWGSMQNRRLAGANRDLREARLRLAHETETERRRIARDLHDQTLADLRRLLLQADEEHAGGPLRGEIEGISNEIRRICEDLSPSVLANVGLTAALEWALADAVSHMPEGEKFEFEFACDDTVEERLRFDSVERIQIYRIVQEAINNVCRHARATRVRLSASLGDDGAFVVELDDDGRGFDADEKRGRSGRGLGNMRARANMIGASVDWSSRPGGGTVFRLTVSREP